MHFDGLINFVKNKKTEYAYLFLFYSESLDVAKWTEAMREAKTFQSISSHFPDDKCESFQRTRPRNCNSKSISKYLDIACDRELENSRQYFIIARFFNSSLLFVIIAFGTTPTLKKKTMKISFTKRKIFR